MKGIYLGACIAHHPTYDIIYQDIDGTRDVSGDMLDINLQQWDYIICTPPCNWYSKLNMEYWRSEYALRTLHLLPIMLIRLAKLKKPFIVENVINKKRFEIMNIYRICETYGIKYQYVGRHTYFTNIVCDLDCPQHQDFGHGGIRVNDDGYNQGGSNVHVVIEKWLHIVHDL